MYIDIIRKMKWDFSFLPAFFLAEVSSKSSSSNSGASFTLPLILLVAVGGFFLLRGFLARGSARSPFSQSGSSADIKGSLVPEFSIGDEVVTEGGLIGIVDNIADDRVWLEIAPSIIVEVLKTSVTQRLEPTDPYSLEGPQEKNISQVTGEQLTTDDQRGEGGGLS